MWVCNKVKTRIHIITSWRLSPCSAASRRVVGCRRGRSRTWWLRWGCTARAGAEWAQPPPPPHHDGSPQTPGPSTPRANPRGTKPHFHDRYLRAHLDGSRARPESRCFSRVAEWVRGPLLRHGAPREMRVRWRSCVVVAALQGGEAWT